MSDHELKCWPEFFDAIVDGRKTFDVRYNDRWYREGDRVRLREFDPQKIAYHGADGKGSSHGAPAHTHQGDYTGRELTARIGFLLADRFGIPKEYVAFSLLDVEVAA